jgi:hypothetical protein
MYAVVNLRCACGRVHGTSLSGARLGQKKQIPPGVCCQATQDGGVACSDGTIFPPG